MTTSLPIDSHDDRNRFPRRPVVTYRPGPFHRPDDIEVQIPTETGDLVVIDVRREEWPEQTYSLKFSGELADVAPEALTAGVQVALLTLREARRFELGLSRVAP